jgi:hypothetical protein
MVRKEPALRLFRGSVMQNGSCEGLGDAVGGGLRAGGLYERHSLSQLSKSLLGRNLTEIFGQQYPPKHLPDASPNTAYARGLGLCLLREEREEEEEEVLGLKPSKSGNRVSANRVSGGAGVAK